MILVMIILVLVLLLIFDLISSLSINQYHNHNHRSLLYMTSNSNLKDKLYIYNTLTREKELFKPVRDDGTVSFYSCGPTVYDYAHIGNFRAFLTYDIIKRWLEYCDYNVDHVCNLTDIDDKIIVKMIKENKGLKELTEKYIQAFFEDLDVLNIKRAQRYPKATDHVKDIETMISTLIQKGYAYEENGSVYFRVKSFRSYGRLANKNFDDIIEGAGGFGPNERRGTEDKESARDFVLWKAFTPPDGDVSWNSNFGKGRPGWHIECSAMCHQLLGETIDLHGGGIDLVFPHHQNEIAQSEAFSDKQFCNYWVHNGFVNINNEKMSKSLQNFKTLRDIAQSSVDARAFRYMVMTSQYRNPLNFTPDTLKSALNSLKRIDKLIAALKGCISNSINDGNLDNMETESASAIDAFEKAMCDDLNTPRASAALFSLIGVTEKSIKENRLSSLGASKVLDTINKIDKVFGILYDVPVAYFNNGSNNNILQNSGSLDEPLPLDQIPVNVKELAEKRIEYKALKKYAEADSIRAELSELGYDVKDVKGGYNIFQKG